jgi:hypothetical protein
MVFYQLDNSYKIGERLFIRMVKIAQKNKDWEFLTGNKLLHCGDYLGVDYNACILVQERYKRRFKMSRDVTCVGCQRVVKLGSVDKKGSYQLQGEYKCAKCRGIEVPKKQKEKTYEEKGLYIK